MIQLSNVIFVYFSLKMCSIPQIEIPTASSIYFKNTAYSVPSRAPLLHTNGTPYHSKIHLYAKPENPTQVFPMHHHLFLIWHKSGNVLTIFDKWGVQPVSSLWQVSEKHTGATGDLMVGMCAPQEATRVMQGNSVGRWTWLSFVTLIIQNNSHLWGHFYFCWLIHSTQFILDNSVRWWDGTESLLYVISWTLHSQVCPALRPITTTCYCFSRNGPNETVPFQRTRRTSIQLYHNSLPVHLPGPSPSWLPIYVGCRVRAFSGCKYKIDGILFLATWGLSFVPLSTVRNKPQLIPILNLLCVYQY